MLTEVWSMKWRPDVLADVRAAARELSFAEGEVVSGADVVRRATERYLAERRQQQWSDRRSTERAGTRTLLDS